MNKVGLVILSIVAFTGCANKYKCNLGEECIDSVEVLEAAKENGGNSESAMHEPEEYPEIRGVEEKELDEETILTGKIQRFGTARYKSKPVYIPDAPMRIWMAPEKTEGILISDYMMYTTVPGGYVGANEVYGKSTGGDGLFGPIDPSKDLGFKPVPVSNQDKVRPR